MKEYVYSSINHQMEMKNYENNSNNQKLYLVYKSTF